MKFEGVYTALVTPFSESGEVEWEAFGKLVERQVTAGVAGVVPVRFTKPRFAFYTLIKQSSNMHRSTASAVHIKFHYIER